MTSETERFTVQIESGLYAGVAETMPPGRYMVGSGIEADIVLVEDGLASLHFAVDTLGPSLRVEALADGVVIEGVATLGAGENRTVALPIEIRIGALRLLWRAAGGGSVAGEAARRFSFRAPALGGVLARHVWAVAAVLIGGGVFLATNPVADASVGDLRGAAPTTSAPTTASLAAPPAIAAPSTNAAASVPSPEPTAPARPLPTLPTKIELKSPPGAAGTRQGAGAQPAKPGRNAGEAAAEALRAEIEKAGLLNVAVSPGVGVVTATGTVEPGATGRWQGVQQRFDERFGGEVTLVNGVGVKADKLPMSLAIEAVWRGQHPHLIIRGQKYGEGALLEGGWAIQRIEAERVLLQRDGRLVAVKY